MSLNSRMSNNTINGISNISASFDTIDELASMKSMDFPPVGMVDITTKPTKSKSRACSNRETGLVVVIVVLILLAVGLIVLLAIFSYNNTSECTKKVVPTDNQQPLVQDDTCSKSTCIHLASRILSLMDTRVAPCDDFYQFACGEGEKGSYISWQRPKQSAYKRATVENQRRMREVLEAPGRLLRGVNSSAVEKTRTYYRSCMNVNTSDREGRIAVLKLIRDMGSWPLTTDAISGLFDPATFDLEDRLSKAFRAGSFPIMVLAVSTDPFNTTWNTLQVGPSTFQVSSEPGKRHVEEEAFINLFTTVTTSFGASPLAAKESAEMVWKLGYQLSQISKGQVWRDALSNIDRPTANEFSAVTRDYLDFSKLVKLTYGEDIHENEKILVLQKDYFNTIGPILNGVDKGVLATYIIWQVIMDMAPYLYAEIRAANELHQNRVYGALTVDEERWVTCVTRTVAAFPAVVDALYIEKCIADNVKHEATEMLEVLQSKLQSQLTSTPWMDSTTVQAALSKLGAMDKQIGYPDSVLNPRALDNAWEQLEPLSSFRELDNVRKIHEAKYEKTFQQRSEMVNTSTWKQPATELLGLYDRFNNKIKFTAGHFQYPYYEPEYTWSMKLGTMGHLMAHELTHAIDNQGRQNDATGAQNNWWSSETVLSYLNQTKCFAEDISAALPFAFDTYLLREVIADTGGIKLAYQAFKDLPASPVAPNDYSRLPGVDLTEEQLFFLAYTQMFCIQDHLTEQNYKKYRVMASLKNTEDFSSVYNCLQGSKMNPVKKCTVW